MDSGGEWIIGSSVPLDQPWRGITKLAKMLASAVNECAACAPGVNLTDVPVLICVAEKDRPGRLQDIEQELYDTAQKELGVRMNESSGVVSAGRVGIGMALAHARQLIYGKHFRNVIIAGVDSFLVGPTLGAFEEQDRLLTSQNSNGFIPGEAGAAILVGPLTASAESRLSVLGIGTGVEQANVNAELPLRADGLVEAIRAALSEPGLDLGDMDYRITDISGEQYYFKEAALGLSRILRKRKEEFDIRHPTDCIGEVGAAIGMVILGVSLAACQKSYSKGKNILCQLGNDDGNRLALVTTYQPVRAD